MRSKCVACGEYGTPDVSMFTLPRDTRRNNWLSILRLDEARVGPYAKVCSTHFHASQFSSKAKVRLKKDAMPRTVLQKVKSTRKPLPSLSLESTTTNKMSQFMVVKIRWTMCDSPVLELDRYFDSCYKLTKECGLVISKAIVKVKNVQTKSSDIDLVTETDQEVEKLLIGGLKKQFSDHKFIGEESVAEGEKCILTDDPTWVIDPVDGTMNFVHGLPLVAISIGLLIKKEPVLGIIYNPLLDQMFTAKKGQGAFMNGKPIRVSGETELSKALVCSEVGSSKDPERIKLVLSNLEKLVGNVHGVRVLGTATWALAMVATGAVDAFCHFGLHVWDLAAAMVIVNEAGGAFLDYQALGSAALNMASCASGGTDAYYEFGIHAWDMCAGEIIIKEAGGVVIDPSGGPFDLMSRRVVCASSEKLAMEIAKLIESVELERD